MDDKTLHALTALAERLGTTAEYLWGVLLRQAPIAGIVDLSVMAMLVVGCVSWSGFVYKKTTLPEDGCAGARWDDDMGVVLAWMSVVMLCLLTINIVGNDFSVAIAGLVNPEYWALHQILTLM